MMRIGDVFMMSGRPVRLDRVTQMEAWVTPAPGALPTVPRWNASKMPLSNRVCAGDHRLPQRAAGTAEHRSPASTPVKPWSPCDETRLARDGGRWARPVHRKDDSQRLSAAIAACATPPRASWDRPAARLRESECGDHLEDARRAAWLSEIPTDDSCSSKSCRRRQAAAMSVRRSSWPAGPVARRRRNFLVADVNAESRLLAREPPARCTTFSTRSSAAPPTTPFAAWSRCA